MLLFFFNLINFKKKKFLHWKTNLKFFHSLHAQWIESLTLHCPWPELTRPSSWGRRPWSHRWWRTGWVWCQGAWGFRRRCWKAPTWSWICSPGSWTRGPRCPDSPPSARSRRWCTRGLPRADHILVRHGEKVLLLALHRRRDLLHELYHLLVPLGLLGKLRHVHVLFASRRCHRHCFWLVVWYAHVGFGLQDRGLDWWVSDLFTCYCVYFKFLGLSFFMWIWWFFWVYGFDLLEVSVEDRDFVCILSIGLLNVSYFSVWFERKSWFSRENVDDCLRKIYEIGWVCCYCEPNWLGLCVFVS